MNFDAWSDGDVLDWLLIAAGDLEKASNEQPETEWHEECFAVTVILAQEANRRGLRLEAA